ncbi:MAG: hypothetical protein EBT07_04645 [Actinobacteria bacterium]|nr:hypothetical protein [Actinomycetota bacterium]NBY44182.1 hypothetical protein [Micrococcales bacterium]
MWLNEDQTTAGSDAAIVGWNRFEDFSGAPLGLMKRIISGLLALLLSVGLLSSSAKATTPLTVADIYNPAKILRVDLSLPKDSVESLNNQQTLKVYVPGTLTMTMGTKTSGALDIKVRLKGATSMQKLDLTPSFKFRFKKGPNDLGYLGLRRMTLNAMTQDTTKLHEYAAYALFNAAGVPAPKTGWARVYVNGFDKGLYVNIETPDETFMSRRFRDITQHIYEGAGSDFWMGEDTGDNKTGNFLVDYGWKVTPNKYDLNNLINYTYDNNKASWYKGLTNVLDRTEMIKFFAVENFIGHWDGYSGPDINNYFIRSNTQGKFTFIPWGTDQTFGENLATWKVSDLFEMDMLSEKSNIPWMSNQQWRGKLYVQCINYSVCKTAYLQALKNVAAKALSMNLSGKLTAAAKTIDPALVARYGGNMEAMKYLDTIHLEQSSMQLFLTKRQKSVADLLQQNNIK